MPGGHNSRLHNWLNVAIEGVPHDGQQRSDICDVNLKLEQRENGGDEQDIENDRRHYRERDRPGEAKANVQRDARKRSENRIQCPCGKVTSDTGVGGVLLIFHRVVGRLECGNDLLEFHWLDDLVKTGGDVLPILTPDGNCRRDSPSL